MEKKTKRKEAKDFGVTITYNPDLDKLTDVVLFPEKLAKANEILANTTFRYLNVKK